jgi:hypothetical protein
MVSTAQLHRYKEALVEALVCEGESFHIVAELPPGAPRAALEDALYQWVARVNRYFLGRNWCKPHNHVRQMKGVVFFETGRVGGHHHAHLVVTPPKGVPWFIFAPHARFLFQLHPEPCFRRLYRPVTRRGQMHVRRIKPTHEDRTRVIHYVAKELEGNPRAVTTWKFIEDLTPRQVNTI